MSVFQPLEPVAPAVPGGEKPVLEPYEVMRRAGQSRKPFNWGFGGVINYFLDRYDDIAHNFRRETAEQLRQRKGARRGISYAQGKEEKKAMQVYDGAGMLRSGADMILDGDGANPYKAGFLLDRGVANRILGDNPSDEQLLNYSRNLLRRLGAEYHEVEPHVFEQLGQRPSRKGFFIAGLNFGRRTLVNRRMGPISKTGTGWHEYGHADIPEVGKEPANTEEGAYAWARGVMNYLRNNTHSAFGRVRRFLDASLEDYYKLISPQEPAMQPA